MGTTAEYRRLFDRITLTGFIILVTIVIGVLCWGIYYSRHYEGILTIDAMNQAQVARHLFRGEGLTTSFLKPVSILLGNYSVPTPDCYISPLPVLILSRFLKVIGLNDFAVLGYSVFWAFFAGILLLLLSRMLFHHLIIALLVFLNYMFNIGVLESSFSGLSMTVISCILLIVIWLYYVRNRSSVVWTMIFGILAGILYLSEFDFLFLAVPLGVLTVIDSKGNRWPHALVFLFAFVLVALPWMIRNAVVTGNPFFSLRWLDFKAFSLPFPGNKITRDFAVSSFASTLPMTILWNKFLMFNRLMYSLWLSLSLSLLLPLFLAGGLLRFQDARWGRAMRLAIILFFSQLALIAAGNGDFARLLSFMPLIVVGGMAGFIQLLADLKLKTEKRYWLMISILCCVNFFPGLISLVYGLPEQRYISAAFSKDEAALLKEAGTMDKIRRMMKDDEVVVSDIPWAVAWYAGRKAVWIPWEIEQMKAIKQEVKNLRFLHLSPMIFRYPGVENAGPWREIYRSGMVPEWLEVDRGILLPGDHLFMGDIIFERLDLE
ncbi:MAG: hypothetical protein V1789_07135 [PVC group bacterium]